MAVSSLRSNSSAIRIPPARPEEKSFRDFLATVRKTWDANHASSARHRLERVYGSNYGTSPIRKAAMGETSGSVGGWLVPPQMSLAIMETIEGESFIWPRAEVVPMESASIDLPNVDTTSAQSAGTAPYFGGFALSFSWNATTLNETEPKFKSLHLDAWDLIGYSIVSNQTLWDMGKDCEGWLTKAFGKAAAWQFEYACLQGLGAGNAMPLGILQSPALLTQTRAVASQIAAADIAGMAGLLLPSSWPDAIWACHPSCLAQIAAISNIFLNIPDADGKAHVGYLLSRKLFVTDKLPALGIKGDLVLFDPSLYVIGNRQEVRVDLSEYDPNSWKANQSTFRIWMRVDGKPRLDNKVTLADGTKTAAMAVALK